MEYRFVLAGNPVAHSLSPAMHRAAFSESGLSGTYDLVRCDESGFRQLVTGLLGGVYSGINVTMPHKGLAHSFCEILTPEAEAAASVNTMEAHHEKVSGHSSDVVAFRKAFSEMENSRDVVLLGAGGSARAALAAFDGPAHVWGRSRAGIEEISSHFPGRVLPLAGSIDGAIVINCTPLGMKGEELPPHILESAGGLIDLPYASGETPAVSKARRDGIPVVDGYRFLAMQAAESFSWWTGTQVSVSSMVEAARNA